MPYTVEIKKQSTGEVRVASFRQNWSEGDVYSWTEGNSSCDCNRHDYFTNRGHGELADEAFPCGSQEYHVSKAVLDDGTEIVLDQGDGIRT